MLVKSKTPPSHGLGGVFFGCVKGIVPLSCIGGMEAYCLPGHLVLNVNHDQGDAVIAAVNINSHVIVVVGCVAVELGCQLDFPVGLACGGIGIDEKETGS